MLGALLGLLTGLCIARVLTRLFRHGSLEPNISNCPSTTTFSNRSPAP
jgi:hypothetical protein